MISIPEELNPNQGIPGWLELDDLSLHGDMVARGCIPLKSEYKYSLREL